MSEQLVQSRPVRTAIAACVRLTLLVAGIWVVMAYPAWALDGTIGLRGLTVATLLCLVPGYGVLFFAESAISKTQPLLVLLASGARMGFVLLCVLVLNQNAVGFGLREFVLWLLVLYFATLVFETKYLVRGAS